MVVVLELLMGLRLPLLLVVVVVMRGDDNGHIITVSLLFGDDLGGDEMIPSLLPLLFPPSLPPSFFYVLRQGFMKSRLVLNPLCRHSWP